MNRKNLFYGLGTISVLTAPIASVIACSSPKPTPDKSKADRLANDLAKINTSSLTLEQVLVAAKATSKKTPEKSLQDYGINFELDGSKFLVQAVEYKSEPKIILTFKIQVNKDLSETKNIRLTKFNTEVQDKQQVDKIADALATKVESTKTFEYLATLNKSAKYTDLGIDYSLNINEIFEIVHFETNKENKTIKIKFTVTINKSKSAEKTLTLSKFNTTKQDNAKANDIAKTLSEQTESTLTFEQAEAIALTSNAKKMTLKDYGVNDQLLAGATFKITDVNTFKDVTGSKKPTVSLNFRIKLNKSESDEKVLTLSVFKNEDKINADKMALELAAKNTSNKSFKALEGLSKESTFADLGITYDLKGATFKIVKFESDVVGKQIKVNFTITINGSESTEQTLTLSQFDTKEEDGSKANEIAGEIAKITTSTKTFKALEGLSKESTFADLGITYDLKEATFKIVKFESDVVGKQIKVNFTITINGSESTEQTLTLSQFDTKEEDGSKANEIAADMEAKINSSTKSFDELKAFVGKTSATLEELGITYALETGTFEIVEIAKKEETAKTITIQFKIIVNKVESEIKTLTITSQQ